MAETKPIPEGYPRVTPYLCVQGAGDAIEFYIKVFGATERMRMPMPGGKVGHAELELGDSLIMLSDEAPEMGNRSPKAIGGTPVTVSVYVEDVDAVFDRALQEERPLYGPLRTSSTATAPASSRIRSGTGGASRPTWRTCPPTRWNGARPRQWAAERTNPGREKSSVSIREANVCTRDRRAIGSFGGLAKCEAGVSYAAWIRGVRLQSSVKSTRNRRT
jgi:hypothetical protein